MNKILVIVLFCIIGCADKKVTNVTQVSLLHINDTHSKHLEVTKTSPFGEVSIYGGSAQLATLIKQMKEKYPNSLAIHAGDAVTGSVFSLMYKGIDASDILNMSSIDLAVLGNHEFDFGLEYTHKMLEVRNFPTIDLNVYSPTISERLLPPTYETNINGVGIGFIGVLTSQDCFSPKERNKTYFIEDEIEAIQDFLNTKPSIMNNDLLILVSHVGFEVDKKIARRFKNVFDVIIGGHSHTYLDQPVKINKTLIVQLDSNIRELGHLLLNFDHQQKSVIGYRYDPIEIKNIPMDPDVVEYLEEKKGRIDKEMGHVIGVLSSMLDDRDLRMKSTPIGNFIVDSIHDYYKYKELDGVMLNSGVIRSSLPKGDITIANIFELHPFDDTLVYLHISGKILKKVLQLSLDLKGDGGFLQLSKSIAVMVDRTNCITKIFINSAPIDEDKIYKIITSQWVYEGGDNYGTVIDKTEDTHISNVEIMHYMLRDLIMNIILKSGYINTKRIDKTSRWIFSS